MKYYCKNCGSEFKPGRDYDPESYPDRPDNKCPICLYIGEVVPIPDYETPQQYEKRTGKPFPDNGLVFVFTDIIRGHFDWRNYCRYGTAKKEWKSELIVIADPPVSPPNTWRPE
jgi:DNA-directed RNA polymerase subunit RPC12/RpoP